MFEDIIRAFEELREEDVLRLVKQKLEEGYSATEVLTKGVIPGLNKVGEKYEQNEYFLAELLFAADLMNKCMEILTPLLEKEAKRAPVKGKIVIGTVKGDIHDIGKNIFATLMRASGFEVFDLGVDVSAEKFVEKVKEVKPDIVGMSALLSTTAPYFKVVIDALKEAGLRDEVFVMIGGPPLVSAEEVGADVYCDDAFKGKIVAEEYVKKKSQGK